MKEKKILFIINHFGKFNNYFHLWLYSCRSNSSINWLIFTDDKTQYNYPENVNVIYTTFFDTVQKFQSIFNFKIELNDTYRLCEFRVTYGEVYAEQIKDYDFWGYCDTDVIWGNLREHITSKILQAYKKISWRGHLTLYKNDEQINSLYRSTINGIEHYKYALSHNTGYALAFDERAINSIFELHHEPIYIGLKFADLKIRNYNFFLLHFKKQSNYKNIQQVFLWESGNLNRLYVYRNIIYKESFAYIHFLKRPMSIDKNFSLQNRFLIVPNKFINWMGEIDVESITALSKTKFYWTYLWARLNFRYLISKVKFYYSKRLLNQKFSFLQIPTSHFEIPD